MDATEPATRSTVQFAHVNGLRLAYEMAGAGQAVVLVHAALCDRRMWTPQIGALTEQYFVIRYDMNGFGESENPHDSVSHADDLRGLLDLLGVESAHLIGASMGGGVAIEFALRHPFRVRSLVLCDAFIDGHIPSDELRAFGVAEDYALTAGDVPAAVDLNLETWLAGPGRTRSVVSPDVWKLVYAMQLRAFEVQLAQTEAEGELGELDSIDPKPEATSKPIDRLGEISCPTLAIVGAYDLPDMLEIASRVEREVPDAERMELRDTAHLPNMERPMEFNQLVLEFLKRQPAA